MTWQSNFSVYQIDFSVTAAGKRVASTKRRIRWRFGFPNASALEEGAAGTDCRGEEHEIVVVWSITSGKRQIMMDTKEIHYSSSRAGILDHSWTTRGNHVIKVICHASPPLSAVPGFRQYDLLIDGQSFFNMPKVYELGLKGPKNSYPGRGGGSAPRGSLRRGAPTTRSQEEEDLKRAIEASLEESRSHLGEAPQKSAGGADLLNFASAPALALAPPPDSRSVASFYSAPPPTYNPAPYQSPPPLQTANPVNSPAIPPNPGALVPAVAPQGYYGAPPPPSTPHTAPPPAFAAPPPAVPQYQAPAPAFAAAPPAAAQYAAPAPPPQQYAAPPETAPTNLMNAPVQSNDVFGLNSAPSDDPFAPKAPGPPTHDDLTNMVMNAYASQPQTPGAAPVPNGQFSPSDAAPAPNGTLQPAVPLTMNAVPSEPTEPQNEMDAALAKLVNVERIDEPAEYGRKLTMMAEEEKMKAKAKNGKSVPVAPIGSGMIGPNASLGQISAIRDTNKPLPQGVMNAPPPGVFSPGAAGQGALVVHGQGPPPLQQAQGFGLGAQMPNGGFAAPQQAQNPYQRPHY